MTIDHSSLQAWVTEAAIRLSVPGVAVAVYRNGEEHYVFHGVTSIENPLPVDAMTLFQFGSTGKTYTATAVMRLVEKGLIDLDEKVRTYVPELRLKDEDVAQNVTVKHLLNHSAGWEGDLIVNTGDGDDALTKYVELMSTLEQVTPLGASNSYNNASLSLAGRVIEKVTGKTYEEAIAELIFRPLDLLNSYFFPNDIMTRRFAVGHDQHSDGTIHTARPWALPRAGAPAGGISSNAADLLTWARFHLGDGRAQDGTRLLSEESLKKMQEPTVTTPMGEYIGLTWMLKDVEGVRIVSHGGDTRGQHSDFVMVPERDFAISTMTNCGPNGNVFNEELVKWILETELGIVESDPEPIDLPDEELAPYAGAYETIAMEMELTVDKGKLRFEGRIKPETMAQLTAAGEEAPEAPPAMHLGILEDRDRYIFTDGPMKGVKGIFVRDANGQVEAMDLGGRLCTRTSTEVNASV